MLRNRTGKRPSYLQPVDAPRDQAKPHILFDISRLMWRATQFSPTGIDRVELAYARHLIDTAHDRLSFIGWWGRFGLLADADATAMVAALHALWSGSAVDPATGGTAGAIARRLRVQALLRGEAAVHARLAQIDGPVIYLLVSHHRLDRPAPLQRLKARGVRCVLLIHDLIPIEHPEHVLPGHEQLHRRRMDTVARLADHVIVNSADTGADLRRHLALLGAAVPTIVAPLGTDLRRSDAPAAAAAQRPYFICVSTIEQRKNHGLLLEVWRRLAAMLGARAPGLVLVGRRGWRSSRVTDAINASPALQSLVQEFNRLPDAAVSRLLGGAHALLYPSFAEGYGLPVAEALALGVPVLCSDLPALREVGGDVPEYLDPNDALGWLHMVLDYAQVDSHVRQAQLGRRTRWHPPRWEDHFAIVQPLLDGTEFSGASASGSPAPAGLDSRAEYAPHTRGEKGRGAAIRE